MPRTGSAEVDMNPSTNEIDLGRFEAVLFDLDGVLTSTASIHARCWKSMFDDFLQLRSAQTGEPVELFVIDRDYRRYVDGRLRYDGVREFLRSRGIDLPPGTPEDPPELITICGLGNRKDRLVQELLKQEGIEVFAGSVALAESLRDKRVRTAVVSASKNCRSILAAAGIAHLFGEVVDGEVAERLQLPGKPAPDTFLKAAELLGAEPSRAVVIEDAIAGVEAARAGGFGLVIGVNRHDDAAALLAHGADLVVTDLAELVG
jgi:beta-phosphoglucomutase family hydrolase